MKVSVLITTYNCNTYIDETIESVINQKVAFPFEIIIGDDGSDDGTIEKLSTWKEHYPKKIRYYVMERETGRIYNKIERASHNRLNILEKAKGEYILFLDGDDVYTDNNKLQKQLDILEDKSNKDCVACVHNSQMIWNDGRIRVINEFEKSFKISGKEVWAYGIYFLSESIMFRNIFEKGIPDNLNRNFFDDNIITFVLLQHGKFYYIPDNMVNYRQHDESIWNSMGNAEKNIVDLMEYDVELQFNHKMKYASQVRHMRQFRFFLRQKGDIPIELKRKYKEIFLKNGLNYTYKWVWYEEQNKRNLMKMKIEFIRNTIFFVFTKMKKKIVLAKYK